VGIPHDAGELHFEDAVEYVDNPVSIDVGHGKHLAVSAVSTTMVYAHQR